LWLFSKIARPQLTGGFIAACHLVNVPAMFVIPSKVRLSEGPSTFSRAKWIPSLEQMSLITAK